VGDNEIGNDRNKGESLAISIAMAMSGTTWGASPNRARPGLHWKPLYAAIGQEPAPYCPGSRHGQQICYYNTKH